MLTRLLLVVTWTVALASSCAPARPAKTPTIPMREDVMPASDPPSAPGAGLAADAAAPRNRGME